MESDHAEITALNKLIQNGTETVVMHRLLTMKHVDQILVFQDGKML